VILPPVPGVEEAMSDLQFDVDLTVGAERRTVSFANGGVVFVKGDRGEFAYLVRSGEVEIRGAGQAFEVVGPGGLFGEMAMIDGGPRSASAVARKASELVVIDRPTFARLLSEVPDFAIKVMRLLAMRLRAADTRAPPETGLPIRPASRNSA
jgi:CRP/FNR family transcriptional regulator, cyclic AMP receptor protein